MTAGRNFFRTLGAAFGLASRCEASSDDSCAAANSIYQSALHKGLKSIPGLSAEDQKAVLNAALTELDSAIADNVRQVYARALRNVFALFAATAGLSLAMSFLIKVCRV